MPKSTSYESCVCGEDCARMDENPDQPCWGLVKPLEWGLYDDNGNEYDTISLHVCQGHSHASESYVPEEVNNVK